MEEINKNNAFSFTSFDRNSIASMLSFYYASRIRGDEEWQAVLPPLNERSGKLNRAIEKHNHWKFEAFKVEGFQNESDKYFTIYYKVIIDGKQYEGHNEAEVQKTEDGWVIKTLPQ